MNDAAPTGGAAAIDAPEPATAEPSSVALGPVPVLGRRSAVGPDLQPTLDELSVPGRSSFKIPTHPPTRWRACPSSIADPGLPLCPRSTSPPSSITSCASRI